MTVQTDDESNRDTSGKVRSTIQLGLVAVGDLGATEPNLATNDVAGQAAVDARRSVSHCRNGRTSTPVPVEAARKRP